MTARGSTVIGGGAIPPQAAQAQYCYLRTTGRVSGRPHEVEMWFAPEGWTLYLLAGGRDRADWVRNIRHDPTVHVRLDEVTYLGTGRIVEGTDDERRAREGLAAKYYGWRSGPLPNAWAREVLPIAIDLSTVVNAPEPYTSSRP